MFSFRCSAFRQSQWCEAEIVLLAQLLKPGDVVLDVGGEHRMSCRFDNSGERLGVSPQWKSPRRNTEG